MEHHCQGIRKRLTYVFLELIEPMTCFPKKAASGVRGSGRNLGGERESTVRKHTTVNGYEAASPKSSSVCASELHQSPVRSLKKRLRLQVAKAGEET